MVFAFISKLLKIVWAANETKLRVRGTFMTVINSNTAATVTVNALSKNERAMNQTMERLATGKQINSAKDDAAGLAISSRMTAQMQGLEQAADNALNAISMIQTADGATQAITDMLQRMRELAVQAATGTLTSDDKKAANVEFVALLAEVGRVGAQTQWNGQNILDNSQGSLPTGVTDTTPPSKAKEVTYQIGANANQVLAVEFGDWSTSKTTGVFGVNLSALDVLSTTNANTALGTISTALDGVSTQRANYGAAMNRLEYTIDNVTNVAQNAEASRSRLEDADYADETTELARTQIIQQAGTAMLAQANQKSQTVLSLLKN